VFALDSLFHGGLSVSGLRTGIGQGRGGGGGEERSGAGWKSFFLDVGSRRYNRGEPEMWGRGGGGGEGNTPGDRF